MRRVILIVAALAAGSVPARADEFTLVLKNHRFTPAELRVKANTPHQIILINQDATADEFDSPALKVEKVVGGNSKGTIRLRPLKPGRYPFTGEFHADTAKGVVVVQ